MFVVSSKYRLYHHYAKYLLYVVFGIFFFSPFVPVIIVYIICPFHEFCHTFICSQAVKLGGILKLKQLENPE